MNLLSAERLRKVVREVPLLQDITFGISQGEKVALVARNGSGKSTLLRILAGETGVDGGQVAINKGCRLAYLPQDPEFEPGLSIMDALLIDENDITRAVKQYEAALEAVAQDSQGAQLQLEKAAALMDAVQGWDYESRVNSVLSQMKLKDLHTPTQYLSGGQKKRLALARLMLLQPDLLLLDEPTNHLDLDTVIWLEEYLSQSHITLLMVTHDRYFLNRICNVILELEEGKLYRHEGNYEYYLEKKEERQQILEATVGKARSRYKSELEWVRRMPKARGTKAKYRLDAFDKLSEVAKTKVQQQELRLAARMQRLGGKILEFKNVRISRGEKQLLDGFNYTFRKGEKVGLVGPNGFGKTTFLNLLTLETPPDSGHVYVGETVSFGYYKQVPPQFTPGHRILDAVKDVAEVIEMADGSRIPASQLLSRFLFPPSMQQTPVELLSGGEKKRLQLLLVLIKNPNFLVLDEPTNDFDLQTLQVLEEFLEEFPGCLVVVSHDRYLLERLCDHLFIFEGNAQIRDFNGTYVEYLEWKEQEEELAQRQKELAVQPTEATPATAGKRVSYKEKMEYQELGTRIAQLEAEQKLVESEMNKGQIDHEQLQSLANRFSTLTGELESLYERYFELAEKVGEL